MIIGSLSFKIMELESHLNTINEFLKFSNVYTHMMNIQELVLVWQHAKKSWNAIVEKFG